MVNLIKDINFAASTALTITIASQASSASQVGRQATIVDNTTNRFQDLLIYMQIKLGTSPTSNKAVYVYLIRDDNTATNFRTDGAGTSDAAITLLNAQPVYVIKNSSAAATGDILYADFLINRPGPKWGLAFYHDTGVALDATAGNHFIRYVGLNPEIQ